MSYLYCCIQSRYLFGKLRLNMKKFYSFTKIVLLLSVVFLLLSCEEKESKPDVSGVFKGEAESFIGKISVKVIIEKNKIEHIDILEYSDTPGYSNVVFDYLPKEVVSNNSIEVDTIGGATKTSQAFLKAVKEALKKAKLND